MLIFKKKLSLIRFCYLLVNFIFKIKKWKLIHFVFLQNDSVEGCKVSKRMRISVVFHRSSLSTFLNPTLKTLAHITLRKTRIMPVMWLFFHDFFPSSKLWLFFPATFLPTLNSLSNILIGLDFLKIVILRKNRFNTFSIIWVM